MRSDLYKYEVVFIGTPVWAWSVTPAIRTLLKENNFAGKKVVLFCTMGCNGDKRAFKQLKELLPDAEIISTFSFRTHQFIRNSYQDVLETILKNLNLNPDTNEIKVPII